SAGRTGILAKMLETWECLLQFSSIGKLDTNGPRIVAHPWSVFRRIPIPAVSRVTKFKSKPRPELFTLTSSPGRSDRLPFGAPSFGNGHPPSTSRDFARQPSRRIQ